MIVLREAETKWPVLSRLLDEALELPPHRRAAWLAALPDEYAAVKPELEQLLARADREWSRAFLNALPPITDADYECVPHRAGDTIGPWRLQRKLGEGGMAEVWLAERCDGLPGPPAAIKLAHGGWRREALAERIARERAILARLNHPHIARLLDAGVTSEGLRYLALEYVDGRRIDDYCRERGLPLRNRLELFLQVAEAIAFAHNMLVIHRDLKPSNILVTGEGDVRVLDFGIAKLLDDGESRQTELTQISGRALTLDYASPEQIAGQPLTVASDVYSLGVVLYELISGVRPYTLRRGSHAALEEAILEVEPRPLSQVAADRVTRRAARGDLDTIALKALRKDPAARYSTVEGFAEDIRRFLQNRPVLARRHGLWYRCSRFVRRHRVAVAVSAAMAITLTLASALTVRQAQIAWAEKRRAEEAKVFLLSTILDAHPYRGPGKPMSALDLLRSLQRRITEMQSADAGTRVELLNLLGASLWTLQDTAGSESVVSRAVQEASALEQSHAQALRARMLRNWVRLSRGQSSAVRREIDELLAAMRRSPQTLPEDMAGALRILSAVALEQGDAAEAEMAALEALRVAESRLGRRHNQAVLSLVDLSYAYQLSEKRQLALETAGRALQRALDAYGGVTTHPNVIKARVAHARSVAMTGDLKRAIDQIAEAAEDTSALFGAESRAAGLCVRELARLQWQAGKLREARGSVERAYAILATHLDPESAGYAALLQLRTAIAGGGKRLRAGRSSAGPETPRR